MTEKRKFTYRLSEETARELQELSKKSNTSATGVVEKAIHELYESEMMPDAEPDESHTDGGALADALRREVELLTRQIDVKDGQIADLAANLKAAQALHAAGRMPKAIEAGADSSDSPEIENRTKAEPEQPRRTRADFLRAFFTGRLGG